TVGAFVIGEPLLGPVRIVPPLLAVARSSELSLWRRRREGFLPSSPCVVSDSLLLACDSDPSTWSYINDDVQFHIGQRYASIGMYDVAVKHMMEILACSHQSKATQELFLSDFLQTVKVGEYQGPYKGLLDKYRPEMVLDTPITEFMTFNFSMHWGKGKQKEKVNNQ
ncbi:hypothetical protein S245_034037, partial [Arachis hypogaea]